MSEDDEVEEVEAGFEDPACCPFPDGFLPFMFR
jgi:hypothetical protein